MKQEDLEIYLYEKRKEHTNRKRKFSTGQLCEVINRMFDKKLLLTNRNHEVRDDSLDEYLMKIHRGRDYILNLVLLHDSESEGSISKKVQKKFEESEGHQSSF